MKVDFSVEIGSDQSLKGAMVGSSGGGAQNQSQVNQQMITEGDALNHLEPSSSCRNIVEI